MSVIAQIEKELIAFVKGSPEQLKELCKSVPDNYD